MDMTPRDMWEERYRRDEYVYGTEPNAFLAERAAGLPRGDALCLAEGEGRNAVWLATQGFRVSSVDLTAAGVDKTLRLAAEHGVVVDAVQGDLAQHDIGQDRWDLVVSVFAHMPPTVRSGLHRRVVHALRPGGHLLLEAYTPDQIGRGTGGPQLPEMCMTADGLRAELDGLEVLHAAEFVRPVLEGIGHTGDGAVVQFLARRPEHAS